MDQELQKRFDGQEAKIDAIYKSVEKTRRYFLMIIWVTVLAFVLPLIGLAFIIPSFLSSYGSSYSNIGL